MGKSYKEQAIFKSKFNPGQQGIPDGRTYSVLDFLIGEAKRSPEALERSIEPIKPRDRRMRVRIEAREERKASWHSALPYQAGDRHQESSRSHPQSRVNSSSA